MKTFLQYMQDRDGLNESAGQIDYDDALKFVLSQLGFDDQELEDEKTQDALSASLNSYPEKDRKALLDQIATTFPEKKSQVALLFTNGDSKTVTDLVQTLTSSKTENDEGGENEDDDSNEPESEDFDANKDKSDPF